MSKQTSAINFDTTPIALMDSLSLESLRRVTDSLAPSCPPPIVSDVTKLANETERLDLARQAGRYSVLMDFQETIRAKQQSEVR